MGTEENNLISLSIYQFSMIAVANVHANYDVILMSKYCLNVPKRI